jgi:hypothetical protein
MNLVDLESTMVSAELGVPDKNLANLCWERTCAGRTGTQRRTSPYAGRSPCRSPGSS